MGSDREDRDNIRDLAQDWVVWRDGGDWQRFRGAGPTPRQVLEPLGG